MVRIERILCPVDFLPASMRAAEYAVALSRNYDANLRLFHVVSPVLYSADEYGINAHQIVGAAEKTARQEIQKLEKKARAAGVKASSDVRTGNVEREIQAAIKAGGAGLLVMGTHARKGLEKWFLGSVTERLLRRSPVPVLTLRASKSAPKAPPELRRILVTTDFSEGTEDALNYAFSLAQESQARITLLHVISDRAPKTIARDASGLVQAVRRRLDRMIPAEARDWCDIRTRVEFGNPYQVILKVSDSEKTNLLVMNIHGKGMLDRALLGSNAERVVRAARCPVLSIPPMPVKRAKRAVQSAVRSQQATARA